MVMKKFVPSCHSIWSTSYWADYGPAYAIVAIVMSFICVFPSFVNDSDFIEGLKRLPWFILLIAVVPIGLFWLMNKYSITRGLIIDGEILIYKGLWKKKISPQDIVAIKITKAIMMNSKGRKTDATDKDGNQLYTMFLLKGYMPWAMNEKEGRELTSDLTFQSCYGEYTLCRLVYDQEVIDHLLRLNPNIVIC